MCDRRVVGDFDAAVDHAHPVVLGHDGPTGLECCAGKPRDIVASVAERLRSLEARGFVYRKYEATIPQRLPMV